MKTILFAALLLLLTACAFAQTQKIAHKSRGGTDADFAVSVNTRDNFGLDERMFLLDSLRILSKTEVVTYRRDLVETMSFSSIQSRDAYVKHLHEKHPDAKIISQRRKWVIEQVEKRKGKSLLFFDLPDDPTTGLGVLVLLISGALAVLIWRTHRPTPAV